MKGPLIGQGRTAEIFAWNDGQVLKLLRSEFPAHVIEYEARIARIISATGLDAPAVGELVEIENRKGLIYERVEGVSMLQLLSSKPWQIFAMARLFATLHAAMHQRQQPDLPSLQERLSREIRSVTSLSDEFKQELLKNLERMPDKSAVCHGDFHPGNILITAKSAVVIDWNNAVRGDPLADIARTSLILLSPILPPDTNLFEKMLLKILRRVFNYLYLRAYAKIRPYQPAQLKAWLPLVAAARLSEKITEEEKYLMALIEKGQKSQ